MKLANKAYSAMLILICLVLAACSGVPGGNHGSGSGSGGGTSSTFTISAMVSGLSGTGLILQNNGTDTLAITVDGTFAFKTKVTGAYAVTVKTQPTNPQQTCTVANGSGTATAGVTVAVSCSVGTFNVGGQVTGLVGSGLVLQNNGKDNLTITTNGTFSFATPANLNDPYNITVLTQPTKPSQVCSVAMGSGTASQNVGTPVVTCSVGTLTIGGSVAGLAGTGLVLQNNGGDNLTIAANGVFSFQTLLASGQTYNVTILTQPTVPPQVCTIANNTGTATATVTSVQITCPPVFEPIGGQVVGLSIPFGQTSQMVLQNNLGDNLPISGNGPFTFVTQIPYGNKYDVDVFVGPNTQKQGAIRWNYQGTATAPVTDIIIDWGHNDWAWLSGKNTGNQNGAYSPITLPILTYSNNAPGGRKYSASWTDLAGNLWLFGGYGYTYNTAIGPQPFYLNEMWEYNGGQSYFGGIGAYWNFITPQPPPAPSVAAPSPRWGSVTWTDAAGTLWLFGGQDGFLHFLNDIWTFNTTTKLWTKVTATSGINETGIYGTQNVGSTSNLPGGRWGATARIDASGNVWLFGGFGYDGTANTPPGLLNDLWKFNVSSGQWTWVSGSNLTNQNGNYGAQGTPSASNVPGGRQAAISWLDLSGNFWLFGGYNLSGTNQPASFNDLWRFSGGVWTWMSGASAVNQIGTFGQQGVSAASNLPGSRWGAAAWTDLSGNLWLFGGQGYDLAGNGSLGDLWAYNPNPPATPADPNPYLPASGQWVWVKGPSSTSQPGVYGIDPSTEFGTFWPHVTNSVSTRYGAAYWYVPDANGEAQFFLFGGEGFDSTTTNGNFLLNDLERYLPYP